MSAQERPNFLIIITDQFNPHFLGYEGNKLVNTPHIDALAKTGVVFNRMYSSQPLCAPARATLFTGLTPRGHKLRMNGIALDPSLPTFTEALRQDGYYTHCCGKIHLNCSQLPNGASPDDVSPADFPEAKVMWDSGKVSDLPYPYYGLESCDFIGGHSIGSWGHYATWLRQEHPDEAPLFFDQVPLESPTAAQGLFNRQSFKWALPMKLHPMSWITDKTIDFLEKASSGSEKPFCLFSSIQDPHPAFAPAKEYCYKYDPRDMPAPIGREGEHDDLPPHFKAMRETNIVTSGNKAQPMNLTDPYYGECAAHYLALIDMIDDEVGRIMKALRDTGLDKNTIVIFMADHGEALGEHGMWGKGPFHFDGVIRVPFIVSCPERFEAGVSEDPIGFIDIAPTILDLAGVPIPEGPVPRICEAPNAPPAWPGHSFVPTLKGEESDKETSALIEMDEDYLGLKLRTLVTKKYRITCYSGQTYGELFDLENDPNELYNLWDQPEYKSIKDDLRGQLLDKIMQTDISMPRQLSRS